ncbi:MAG: patatin-like phospholipase family protein [Lachnospiraceae bacterium]|jgi:NTE family protein|nr:patatin-like phospholipase family protein [Lachnospiraceae bacterium]
MKIGLALSGGGVRGIAHAGAIKALEENNIHIDIIGGTSAGSLVAALYAIGYSPYYIYILFKKYAESITELNTGLFSSGIKNFVFGKKIAINGLKTGESIEKAYNDLCLKKGIRLMEQIKMPIVIPAVDLVTEKEYVFTSNTPDENEKEKYITNISVGKAVRSSASFPLVFSPCEYKNHMFIDGGVLDNTPANEVKKMGADKVISIKFESDKITDDSNIMDIVMKVIDIMGSKVSEESLNISDCILTIPSDGTGLLDTSNIEFCYRSRI